MCKKFLFLINEFLFVELLFVSIKSALLEICYNSETLSTLNLEAAKIIEGYFSAGFTFLMLSYLSSFQCFACQDSYLGSFPCKRKSNIE